MSETTFLSSNNKYYLKSAEIGTTERGTTSDLWLPQLTRLYEKAVPSVKDP